MYLLFIIYLMYVFHIAKNNIVKFKKKIILIILTIFMVTKILRGHNDYILN